MSRRTASAVRRGGLLLAVVVVFLTFGLPRWLAGDVAPVTSDAADLAKLCRAHGGTPTTTPGVGTTGVAQRFCTVRYGRHVYRMDAITSDGFDHDTARYQRRGCEEARREQAALTGPGQRPRTFVYHPTTGVCEHRP